MKTMTDVRSVAAGATVENVLAGKLHEFCDRPSAVVFAITASAVGLRASFLVGGMAIVQDQEVSAANRFPLLPDDVLADSGGLKGDRITVSLRNPTGGAITANTKVTVSGVGL